MTDKKTSQRLLSPFTLIDTAWQEYLKRVPFYTKLLLPPVLYYLTLDTFSYMAEHGAVTQPLVMLAQFIEHTPPLSIFLYLLAFILQTFSTAAVLSVFVNPKITSITQAYQDGTKNITSFWWVSLLSFLIISGGFILLIIPGLILSVWFTFAQYVLFKEQKQGIGALLQSREYVRGYFWPLAGRILFIALIVGALSSLSGYVSVIFSNELLAQIAQSAVSLVTVPLAMLYQYILYENAKSFKPDPKIITKTWWMYTLASLVPFILILMSITLALFMKPMQIKGNAMLPTYKDSSTILWGAVPVSKYPANNAVVYRNGSHLMIRRIFAGPGDRLTIAKEMLTRNGKSSPVSTSIKKNIPFEGSIALSAFKPSFPLSSKNSTYILKNDEYLLVSDNVHETNPNWDLVKKQQIVGAPYFCLWNCSGKE